MGWLFLLSIARATCLSDADLWNARCDTGCQREHYSGGMYVSETSKCRCYDDFQLEAITKKKMTLPKQNPGRGINSYEGVNEPYLPKADAPKTDY